jgi:hypothetical protein
MLYERKCIAILQFTLATSIHFFLYITLYANFITDITHIYTSKYLIPRHKQQVACISRHTVSAHHPNTYDRPHNLPVTTNLEHWLLQTFLTSIFKILYPDCLILYNTFYIINVFIYVTVICTFVCKAEVSSINHF